MNQQPLPGRRRALARAALACAALSALAGCATVDPLEPVNRKVFAFNDAIDGAVLKPTALFYRDTVPYPVRTGVRNFFANVKDVWSAANLLLQGRVGDSFQEGLRFSLNTVFGIAGTIDIAGEMGIESHRQDLGLTLGRWGMKPGPYIVLPLMGPTTLRDSASIPFDNWFSPETFVQDIPTRNLLTVLHLIDTRTNLLVLTDVLDDVALDRYTFVRDGWLQRRENLIHDGDDDAPADGQDGSALDGGAPSSSIAPPATLQQADAAGTGPACVHKAILPQRTTQAALRPDLVAQEALPL